MTLRALFTSPQATIPQLVDKETSWSIPFIAFAFLAFAEGADRIGDQFPDGSGAFIIFVALCGAFLIGSWSWALVYGGVLHLAARLLRGKEGFGGTVRAVGFGLFWPGVVATVAAAAVTYVDREFASARGVLLLFLLVQLSAAGWGLVAAILALRAWHGFSWGKAIAAYLLGLGILFVPVVILVLAFAGRA